MQLDLFIKEESEYLKQEFLDLKKQLDNVRKGIFARHTELARLYLEQQKQIDDLRRQLNGETKIVKIESIEEA
jgi:hypothetical protein